MNAGRNNVIETRMVRNGLSYRSSAPCRVITMLDAVASKYAGTLWALGINTFLHELGLPVPMVPVALLAGACRGRDPAAEANRVGHASSGRPRLARARRACRGGRNVRRLAHMAPLWRSATPVVFLIFTFDSTPFKQF